MISAYEKNCTGCRACEASCPKGCISIKENNNGFLLPEVDTEKCISCNICSTICPVEHTERNVPLKVYAAYSKADALKSTSGGVFSVLAKQVLDNNGIVYGTAFSEHLEAETIRIDSIKELVRLQGSKYVQGNTLDTYKQVSADLKTGLRVLYSGTPCQIAGLKKYLRSTDTSQLITAEIICHGVTSPQMFKDYIDWYEKHNKCRIKDYSFRAKSKENGRDFCFLVTDTKGNAHFSSEFKDPYNKAYMSSEWFREVCYSCPFAAEQRVGDITLGDFWNADALPKGFGKNRRVSVVIINSEYGDALFNDVKSLLIFTPSSWEAAKAGNSNLFRPTSRSVKKQNYAEHRNNPHFFDELSGLKGSIPKYAFNQLPMDLRRSIKKTGAALKHIVKG